MKSSRAWLFFSAFNFVYFSKYRVIKKYLAFDRMSCKTGNVMWEPAHDWGLHVPGNPEQPRLEGLRICVVLSGGHVLLFRICLSIILRVNVFGMTFVLLCVEWNMHCSFRRQRENGFCSGSDTWKSDRQRLWGPAVGASLWQHSGTSNKCVRFIYASIKKSLNQAYFLVIST